MQRRLARAVSRVVNVRPAPAVEERGLFLNFATACPHLPPVGLAGLAIEIQPQEAGRPLPTARTCTKTLRLPAYETAEALRAGLEAAFANLNEGGVNEQVA